MDSQLSITTPALLFPAISLIMLAYTNRFLAISSLIRNLHDSYRKSKEDSLLAQIQNLRLRLRLIRDMQALGIGSLIGCVTTMFMIYENMVRPATYTFALSLLFFLASLGLSMWEIVISTRALNIRLRDIEDQEKGSILGFQLKKG
jgi:hypothetical protein